MKPIYITFIQKVLKILKPIYLHTNFFLKLGYPAKFKSRAFRVLEWGINSINKDSKS